MPRFIDMTDAQKAQAWKRHYAAGGVGSRSAAVIEAEGDLEAARAALAMQPNSLLRAGAVRRAEERLAHMREAR